MKKKDSFWDKVRIFIMWIKQEEGYGLRASCDFCRSTKIDRIGSRSDKVDKETIHYKAGYECKDCGAKADVQEVWTKKHHT